MSKRHTKQTAGAVRKRDITFNKCISQINLAIVKLNRLEQAGDDLRLRRVATSIAGGLERGLALAETNEECRSLLEAFGGAVLRLHEAVGTNEEGSLLSYSKNKGYTMPITHQAEYRGRWDGVRGSWEDPKFEKAKGLARLKNRTPPIDIYLHTIDTARYAKTTLVALIEEIGSVSELDPSEAIDRIPALLKEGTVAYCKFNSSFGDPSLQFAVVYLHSLEKIIDVCGRLGARNCGLGSYKVIGGMFFDEIFWFVTPDLPLKDESEALAAFVGDCEAEVRKRTKELCNAELWLYVPWVYSLAKNLEWVVAKAIEIDKSYAGRMYRLMAWTFRQLAVALRKEDPYMFRPHWLTLPIVSYSDYSLGETLDSMRRVTRYAVHTNWDRAIDVIPKKFRQCTYDFCLGMNFEECMIPRLADEYDKTLEEFETRVRSLSENVHAPVERR